VLTEDAFKFYDETKKDWSLEPGKFIIKVGSSSRDIKQTAEIVL
jgi:beta-glucosidase